MRIDKHYEIELNVCFIDKTDDWAIYNLDKVCMH